MSDAARARLLEAAGAFALALVEALANAGGEVAAVGPAPDSLLTVAQLAAHLCRSPSTVRAWVEAGQFEGAVKVGRGWLIPVSAVAAFLERQHPTARAEEVRGVKIRVGPGTGSPWRPDVTDTRRDQGPPDPDSTCWRCGVRAWRTTVREADFVIQQCQQCGHTRRKPRPR